MTYKGKGFAHNAGDREARQPGVSVVLISLKSGRANACPQKTENTRSSLDLEQYRVKTTPPKEQGPLATTHISHIPLEF